MVSKNSFHMVYTVVVNVLAAGTHIPYGCTLQIQVGMHLVGVGVIKLNSH